MNKRMKNREKTRGKEWTQGLMRLDRTTSLSLSRSPLDNMTSPTLELTAMMERGGIIKERKHIALLPNLCS